MKVTTYFFLLFSVNSLPMIYLLMFDRLKRIKRFHYVLKMHTYQDAKINNNKNCTQVYFSSIEFYSLPDFK